jgi:hypothetical protein
MAAVISMECCFSADDTTHHMMFDEEGCVLHCFALAGIFSLTDRVYLLVFSIRDASFAEINGLSC